MSLRSTQLISALLILTGIALGLALLVQQRQPESSWPATELGSTTNSTSKSDGVDALVQQRQPEPSRPATELDGTTNNISKPEGVVAILKDVGEAAYPHFGLTAEDFSTIKAAGFDVIEGNFDICANNKDVTYFLDSAQAVGLKVLLTAGAGEAEWGYPCDDNFTPHQKPVWQSEKVKQWVTKWKDHPALYAWDTSNEDGGTFPFGVGGVKPDPAWETTFSLSVEQLQQAYRDVKSVDSSHRVMIRMNGWYFYDYADNFFRPGNSFGKNVADIVMVNAYSNVDEYFPDFVLTVLLRATRSIYALDPKVTFIPSLGVWNEPPLWVKPTTAHLINDYNQALKTENLVGVAFFKYGASAGGDWYLPDRVRGDTKLWQTISKLLLPV